MAEVALSLATSYASSKNLSIVGLYEAPELVSDRTVSQQATKLAEKIATLANRDALLLLVDNAKLLSPESHSLSGYSVGANASGKGEAKQKALQGSAVSLQNQGMVKELEGTVRKEKAWEKISDFDGKYLVRNGSGVWKRILTTCLICVLKYRSSRRPIIGLVAELCNHSMIDLMPRLWHRPVHTIATPAHIPRRINLRMSNSGWLCGYTNFDSRTVSLQRTRYIQRPLTGT